MINLSTANIGYLKIFFLSIFVIRGLRVRPFIGDVKMLFQKMERSERVFGQGFLTLARTGIG
jgi:hypothetical protein